MDMNKRLDHSLDSKANKTSDTARVYTADELAYKVKKKPEVNYPLKISGLAYYVPENKVSNKDLEAKYGISEDWIKQVSGIENRHISDQGETCSDLALQCSLKALKNAETTPDEIDMIILASVGPDYSTPPTACILQDRLGAKNAIGIDIEAACMGFVLALFTAAQFLKAKTYKNILVIASEPTHQAADYTDQNTHILLGEGAAAAVVTDTEESESKGIISHFFKNDGSRWDAATILAGGSKYPKFYEDENIGKYLFKMNGKAIYKFAVGAMSETFNELLEGSGYTADDIDLVIPHQANKRILDAATKRLKISPEKVFINIDQFGNTSAATIPIALADAAERKRIKSGDLVAIIGFGAGLSWGGVLVKW